MHAAVTPLLLLALSALFVNATPTPLPPYVESSKKCPPKNFATVTAFDINAYVGKWYVQAQQPTRYLPEKRNYCVTANYTILDSKTIKVVNYANDNAVNGQPKGGELRAIIKDPAVPSKLSVGPKFLPDSIKGPYWIVKTGPIFEDTGLYSWAVIVGGSPIYENRENGKRWVV